MNRLYIAVAVLFIVVSAFAQITGTPHDLSSATGAGNTYHSTDQSQICIFCHTPHNASATQTPLWNRTNPTSNYPTYWSPTINAYTSGATPNVSGTSLMCLSCHDGAVALNSLLYSFNGVPTMNTTHITGSANLGTSLTNDHPVSFTYADAITGGDGELVANPPAGTLISGNVECSSCHDVHKYGADANHQPFLNASKAGSAICLQCHVK